MSNEHDKDKCECDICIENRREMINCFIRGSKDGKKFNQDEAAKIVNWIIDAEERKKEYGASILLLKLIWKEFCKLKRFNYSIYSIIFINTLATIAILFKVFVF